MSGRNDRATLEVLVSAWMADEGAPSRAPEALLDEVFAQTSRLRPERRWLAVLREPSMRSQTRVVVGIPARGLVLAAIIAALVALTAALVLIGSQLLRPMPRPLSDDNWPMFRGDATRTGLGFSGPVGNPIVRWRFQARGAITKNISIVGDSAYVVSDEGVLHALRLADGTEWWSLDVGLGASGPSVVGGVVYIVDGNGLLHAIDAATGDERWRSTRRLPVLIGSSGPAIGGDAAYLGTADGTLVAVEATTGQERWRTTVSPSGGAVNAPAYADGLVFVGTARDGFVAVDSASGTIRWRVDTASDVTGTPVVATGVTYIGAASDAATGHSWAIDAATGRVIWRIDEPFGAPTIANGVGYSGGNSGAVTARELTTGKELWRATLQGIVRAPAVAQGIVYLPADGEHRVYALDAATGSRLWRFDVDGSNTCCIAVAKGSVFVGTSPGTVYSIGGDGRTVTPVLGDATASGVASAARPPEPASASPAPGFGPVLARFIGATTLPGDHVIPTDLALDPSGRIWVAAGYGGRFAILDHQGRFIEYWGKPGSGRGEFDFLRSNGDAYGGIAFAPDGSFFVLEAGNQRVQKFDRDRHFVKSWGGFGTGPANYNDPVDIGVGRDGNVYVLDDVRGVVEKYDTDGNVLGQIAVFSNTSPGFNKSNAFAIDQRGNVYISQIDPNQVAEFDPNGTLIRVFGDSGPGAFREQPGGLAIDPAGRLIVDQGPERDDRYGVEVFDGDGTYIGGWGPAGTGDGEITFPTALILDGGGGVFVGEANPDAAAEPRILRFALLPPLAP